jgi:hypothetical protein
MNISFIKQEKIMAPLLSLKNYEFILMTIILSVLFSPLVSTRPLGTTAKSYSFVNHQAPRLSIAQNEEHYKFPMLPKGMVPPSRAGIGPLPPRPPIDETTEKESEYIFPKLPKGMVPPSRAGIGPLPPRPPVDQATVKKHDYPFPMLPKGLVPPS